MKKEAAAVTRMRKVRDSILLGRMHAEEVASAIGAKFAEYDVPFRFPSIPTGSAGW